MEIDELAVKITGDSTSLQGAMRAASEAMSKVGTGAESLTAKLDGISKTSKNLGIALSASLTLPILAAAKSALDSVGSFQLYQASFETMLGSAEKAASQISVLQDMAARTPFELGDLANATKTLLQFNVAQEEVMPLMQAMGDISLGNQANFQHLALAFGQVSGTGKLMAQDMNQMISAGFNPLQEISKRTGRTLGELKAEMADGNITVKMVSDAFKSAASSSGMFFNGMEKASKTLPGLLSTLKDDAATAGRAFASLFAEQAMEAVKALSEFAKWLTDLPEPMKQSIVQIAALTAVMGPLALGISAVTKAMAFMVANPIVAALAVAAAAAAAVNLAIGAVKSNALKATKEMTEAVDKATKDLIIAYAGLEDPIQKRIRLEKEAAERARQAAQAAIDKAEKEKKAEEELVAAQIKGRKEAQKAYEDSLLQIETKVKLGVMTEQEAADAKYLINKKLIDDLVALGYTGAKETGQIGDTALADAVARNAALYKDTSDMLDKIVRAYETAAETVAAHRKAVLEGFRETREAEKAEAEAIEASKRAAETVAVVRQVIKNRFIAGKQEEQAAIRDAEQAELDAINATVETRDAAAKVVAVLAAKNAAAKRAQWREDKEADKVELEAIEAAKRADETTTIVRQQLAKNFRKEKLEIIKEVRDADIAASTAIAEADLMAAKVKSTTDLLQKQARLEKLQTYRDARIAEQAELDLVQAANAEYRNLETQRLVLSQKYRLSKQQEFVAIREAEKAEHEAIQQSIRDAKTAEVVRDVLARRHAINKQAEIKAIQDAQEAEYEVIQENLRTAEAVATVLAVLTMQYSMNKRLEMRAMEEVGRAEYEAIQSSIRAAETAEIQKAVLTRAHAAEKIKGFKEERLAEQAELDKLADYMELTKRNLIPQAGLSSLISQEKQDQITITQITASESEKQIEIIKQQLLLDLDLHKNNAIIKKALMDKAAKDIYAVQAAEFTTYARTIFSLSSQLFSGIGSLISAQADSAVDVVEKRLEALKKSYGSTASELQTMYDALEKMGATDKAATIKAQLDKQKAVEDYASLSMDQLASLYATAIELGDDQAAAEITSAMARVKAEKDAAEEIKKIKYDAAVAEWNMKLMSTTASAAQAVMDTYKAMISLGPLGITIAPIAAAASAAFGITQIAAVAEARPKLDTGGVVRAREDMAVPVVGRGTGEIMFGTSALGDPLMQGFADLVAARVSRSPGASRLLPVQIVLDGRVVAESTVKLIDDGQVRFRKPLKVAQR